MTVHFSDLETRKAVRSSFPADHHEFPPSRRLYVNIVKRALDVILVLLFAPIIVPVVAILALLIATDGGNPFYSQLRIGKNGKPFRIWKLRTMVVDADDALARYLIANRHAKAEWDRHQKLKNDPRITVLGRMIRKTSLDELPQLLNVLLGTMSLVGPRPMMVEQASLYHGVSYFKMLPGVTGLWQI